MSDKIKLAMSQQDIDNVFTYHKPTEVQQVQYELIRERARHLAHDINSQCPESREKSLALTKLREAVMWANAAIACNE